MDNLFLAISAVVVCSAALAWLASQVWGVRGIFLGLTIGNLVGGIVAVGLARRSLEQTRPPSR